MQFRPTMFDFTLYSRQGENNRDDGSVGITFKPTPCATRSDINTLIDELQIIQHAMMPGSDPID